MAQARSWEERYSASSSKLAMSTTQENRFYILRDAAKAAVELGKLQEAEAWAKELLVLADQYKTNWNYGNAVHDGHLVLGRVALRHGDVGKAKDELLAAGKTAGSPQLDSFGPNMALAKDLLEAQERETVLQISPPAQHSGSWITVD